MNAIKLSLCFAVRGSWIAAVLAGCAATANPPPARQSAPWAVRTINPRSPFEGAGAADFDNDGIIDVFSGDSWYRGPAWTQVRVRNVTASADGHYHEDFGDLPLDVNSDGRTDIVTCSYFGGRVAWIENPVDPMQPWAVHTIDTPGPSEACQLVDLDGDGDMDVLPNTIERAVWYEWRPAQEPTFVRHDLGPGGHGVGAGDVNGDGRIDVLGPRGWFESPARPAADDWIYHQEWAMGNASIPIIVVPPYGARGATIVWGAAHDYGIRFMPPAQASSNAARWAQPMLIDETFSQVHALLWADLGLGPMLIAGKRIYAHAEEPGATEAPFIAAYTPSADAWRRTILFRGQAPPHAPADAKKRNALVDFPGGSVGTGLMMQAVDLDGDSDLDLLCPGKSGLFYLENPVR